MYDLINLPELKRMASLAEAEPTVVVMQTWWSCGTGGCLVGTWCMYTPNDQMQLRNDEEGFARPYLGALDSDDAVAVRFGIPLLVASFLFTSTGEHGTCDNAASLTKDEAVSRLRKYINYVERKRALFAEHEWLIGLSRKDRRERLLSQRRELQPA